MKSPLPILLCFLAFPAVAQQAAPSSKTQPANAKTEAAKPDPAPNPTAAPAKTEPTKTEPSKHEPTASEHPGPVEETGRGRRQRSEQGGPPPASAVSTEAVDETPVVTHHKITVDGKTLAYTATVAQMPIKNARGETEAHIFYMAYTLDGANHAKRPVTFAFNGGPGSASIWVHMGAMGPRSPKLTDKGDMPPPPFQLIDDEFTWLGQTDLVFIDPVGTGYSRAKTPEAARQMNGVDGDLESVGEFIRMYITRNERWDSPLLVAGESYGTFRAAGLADRLFGKGIALNGIVLISTVLDMGIIRGKSLAEGPALELPTMTANAWYHKKLPADLQQKDLKTVLAESEHWAMSDYMPILNRGTDISPGERKATLAKLVRYTGLKPHEIERTDLRVDAGLSIDRLLESEKLILGSYDGRITAPAPIDSMYRGGQFEPSGTYVRPPFTTAFEKYIRGELGYKTDMAYNVLVGLNWNWEAENGYAETARSLKSAMYKNKYMKVMICAGYYDSVTPYFSVRYTFNQLGLRPEMLANVDWEYYEAGHMMYIDRECHRKLKQDFANFVKRAVPQ